MIAAAAMSSLAGCVAGSGDTASNEAVGSDSEATCSNQDGTNAAIASLATAMANQMHRWEILTDFYSYVGDTVNNRRMLGLTGAGLGTCNYFNSANPCEDVKFMLSLQDLRYDQTISFTGQKLSAWTYASRLVSGFDRQTSCRDGRWCPYEPHGLYLNTSMSPNPAPGACASVFTYWAGKPTGGALNNTANLKNALVWAFGNGDNPFISFSNTAYTVTADPDGGVVGGDTSGTTSGATSCQPAAGTTYGGTTFACQASSTAAVQLTGQPCQNGSACGTLYKAWPAYPNKYKCTASGC